ncbi:Hpt domain-containing protein, partial [bacterium]|nr:Hpt domain-containing protein [bacterium]
DGLGQLIHFGGVEGALTPPHIDTAFAAHDTGAIGATADKLKSSSRSVGADILADLCAVLEQSGKADDWAEVESQYPRLAPAFEAVMDAIEAFRIAVPPTRPRRWTAGIGKSHGRGRKLQQKQWINWRREGGATRNLLRFEHIRTETVARIRIGVPGETSNFLPDPLVSRCLYPDMLRSNPRCEAPGTTSRFCQPQGGPAARGDVEG